MRDWARRNTTPNPSEPATDYSLSVVIPAFNEESRLPATLERVSAFLSARHSDRGDTYEVLVVDNGSTDRTSEVVRVASERDPSIRLCFTELRGKGRAVRLGVGLARGKRVAFCDADLSTPIEEVVGLADRIHDGHPVVIATREGLGARRIGEPVTRHLMGRVFNAVVRTLAVPGIQDTQCGFKAFSEEAARAIFSRQTVTGFGFDVEILYIARKLGYGILEVPVTWVYAPSSRVDPVKDTLRMLADIARVRWNDLRGVYR
ncbi:MAG: dolichyl-phosphate beta-glucosyltransferase [Chloroflexota bacterium]